MDIDPGTHVPIYLQIADAIRRGIAAAVYRPGESLPSQRSLAVRLQVNPNTVQKAYDELAREGLVYVQRGRGLFVAERSAGSAQTHAVGALRTALAEAIRTARAAGIRDQVIRDQFQAVLKEPVSAGEGHHGRKR